MNKMNYLLIFACLLVVLSSTVAFAAIGQTMAIQGRLTNATGSLSTGSFNFTYIIWDDETTGTALWTQWNDNDTDAVSGDCHGAWQPVQEGIFNQYLGSTLGCPLNISFDDEYWLELIVNDSTLTPRHRISSAAYGFRANITEYLGSPTTATGNLDMSSKNITNIDWLNDIIDLVSGGIDMANNFIKGASWVNATDVNASSKVYATELCIGTDCKAAWPTGDVTGGGTSGYIAMWNGTSSLNNSNMYKNGTKIGIGTTNPTEELDISGDINMTGSIEMRNGVKIGSTNSGGESDVVIGRDADATGYYGQGAVAIGYDADVEDAGGYGIAIGHGATTAGGCGENMAIGHGAAASWLSDVAIGSQSWSGRYTTAVTESTAVGAGAWAVTRAVAIGSDANATTDEYETSGPVALGAFSTATGQASIALGGASSATGNRSIAIGYGANNSIPKSLIIGIDTPSSGNAFFMNLTDGRIGIGTLTPNANFKLDLINGAMRINYDSPGTKNLLQVDDNVNFLFVVNGSTGYVGMGTANPTEKLDVEGNVNLGNEAYTAANTLNRGYYVYKSGTTSYGMKLQYTGSEFGTMMFGPAQANRFISFGKVGAALEDDDMVEYMRIDLDSGNVSIGTTTASRKLEVAGDIKSSAKLMLDHAFITDDSSSSYTHIQPQANLLILYNNTATVATEFRTYYGGGAFTGIKRDVNYGELTVSGTNNDLYINANQVGIGTNAPNSKLEVVGNTTMTATSGNIIYLGNTSRGQFYVSAAGGVFMGGGLGTNTFIDSSRVDLMNTYETTNKQQYTRIGGYTTPSGLGVADVRVCIGCGYSGTPAYTLDVQGDASVDGFIQPDVANQAATCGTIPEGGIVYDNNIRRLCYCNSTHLVRADSPTTTC